MDKPMNSHIRSMHDITKDTKVKNWPSDMRRLYLDGKLEHCPREVGGHMWYFWRPTSP